MKTLRLLAVTGVVNAVHTHHNPHITHHTAHTHNYCGHVDPENACCYCKGVVNSVHSHITHHTSHTHTHNACTHMHTHVCTHASSKNKEMHAHTHTRVSFQKNVQFFLFCQYSQVETKYCEDTKGWTDSGGGTCEDYKFEAGQLYYTSSANHLYYTHTQLSNM